MHMNCLSAEVCPPENVPSKAQVLPPSADLYARICRLVAPAFAPMVVAHAVPSLLQPTVGSVWNESPGCKESVVWPQLSPPSSEKNCACRPLPRLFEAAMIRLGLAGSIWISDSLRGEDTAPEIRR